MRRTQIVLAIVLATTSVRAQTPDQKPLTFEVASIKANVSGDFRRQMGPAPGGRFTATNVPLRDLAAYAFGVPLDSLGFRVIGGPSWIDTDRFDVVASVNGTWTPQQMRDMIRSLLADRFKLAAHNETRELPIYVLVLANGPPRLRRSVVDQAACDARRAAIQRREPVPPLAPGAPPICGTDRVIPGKITALGESVTSLASTLGQFVARAVVDRTGLTGLFDFDLTWTPDNLPQRASGTPNDQPLTINGIAIDPNGPSLVTALQEQLGLKLESTKGPVDVIVIDHVEKPTAD
jgi:uncharacterized protein (TIGR03435 family)